MDLQARPLRLKCTLHLRHIRLLLATLRLLRTPLLWLILHQLRIPRPLDLRRQRVIPLLQVTQPRSYLPHLQDILRLPGIRPQLGTRLHLPQSTLLHLTAPPLKSIALLLLLHRLISQLLTQLRFPVPKLRAPPPLPVTHPRKLQQHPLSIQQASLRLAQVL